MARDYGNRRSSRRNAGAPHQLLVIAVTFLLGYLTATVLDIKTLGHWMNTQVLASNEEKPVKAEQKASLPPKPKFEFYTLLANEKVASTTQPNSVHHTHSAQSVSSTAVTAAANTTRSTPSAALASAQAPVAANAVEAKPNAVAQETKNAYLVQVASFKTRADAEHMKGLLTLKGFDVNVVPIVSPVKGSWFRVVIGPYSNHLSAQQAQLTLAKTEHLNGMIRRVGG